MENKKLEAARNHYMTGDYQAALKLYLSLLNTNISYKLYHRIGKCYYKIRVFPKIRRAGKNRKSFVLLSWKYLLQKRRFKSGNILLVLRFCVQA